MKIKKIARAIAWFTAGAIIVLAILAIILANPLANHLLKHKLNSTIAEKFRVKTADASIDIFDGNVYISRIQVNRIELNLPDTSTTGRYSAHRIDLRGLNLIKFIATRNIECDSIIILNPKIDILTSRPDTSASRLQIKPPYNFLINCLCIKNADIKSYISPSSNPTFSVKNLNLNLKKLTLSKGREVTPKTIRFQSINLSSSEVLFHKRKALYSFSADSLQISTDQKSAKFLNCRVMPQYSKYRFGEVVGRETARIECSIDSISLNRFEIERFLLTDSLNLGSLAISKFRLNIFKDKRLPHPSNLPEKPLPQHAINSIRVPLRVDTIIASRGHITYEGHMPGAVKSGSLYISNAGIKVIHLSNLKLEKRTTPNTLMLFSGNLMGEGRINARFSLPKTSAKPMTYSGSISSMDLRKFNSFLQPSIHLKVKSGKLNRLDFTANANEQSAMGELTISYTNLSVSVQKLKNREILENSNLDWVVSLLINSLLIKKDNPSRGKELRVGTINFERDPTRFVTHYWIQSLLTAIPENLGIPKKIRDKHLAKKASGKL